MVWPEASGNTSFQLLMALLPVLVIVRFSVRPVFQALTVSETLHAPEPPLDADGEGDALADAEAEGEGEGKAEAEALGDELALPSRPKKWTAMAAIPLCGR